MKHILFIAFLILSTTNFAQIKGLQLKNALIIGQMDKPEDRYSLEINVTEIFSQYGIKAVPSLNMLKLGSDPDLLTTDSVQRLVTAKGIDTYLIVTVRGYDKKFKSLPCRETLNSALNAGSLFPIYRDEVSSVSFEFMFFRNGACVGSEIIKCGNVSNRDTVIKRLRKKLNKKIEKKWR